MGALALCHAAAEFLMPCIALVRMDMSLFEDVSLLIQNRLGGTLTAQVSADARITVRGMLMAVGFRNRTVQLL